LLFFFDFLVFVRFFNDEKRDETAIETKD